MTPRIDTIVIDCPDPEALAAFYAELLELRVLRRPPDLMVIGREGAHPRLAFQAVEEGVPGRCTPTPWVIHSACAPHGSDELASSIHSAGLAFIEVRLR
jgi:catechol 2,3-dioxygenase-like lactoylglutathione lyase family enzyme